MANKSPYFTENGSPIPVASGEASLDRAVYTTDRRSSTILPPLASLEEDEDDSDQDDLGPEQTKQRGGRVQGQEVDQLKDRPGPDTMFPDCEVSASEIHIFLPTMLRSREATLRILGNGVTALEQTQAINWAVDDRYDHTRLYNLMRKRSSAFTAKELGMPVPEAKKKGVTLPKEKRMNTSYWIKPRGIHHMVDRPLLDIAQQVPVEHWPSGLDAGPLTKALQLALDSHDETLMISMIPKLMAEHNWTLPQESGNRDRQCFDRLISGMKGS